MKNEKKIKHTLTRRAFELSTLVIKMLGSLPQIRFYWIISDQLIRSSTSIGANIVETKSASSKKDYINLYTHALKRVNETVYRLNLLNELRKAPIEELTYLK